MIRLAIIFSRNDYEKKKQSIEEMIKSLNKKKIKNKNGNDKSKKELDKKEENNLSEEEKEETVKNDNFKTFYINRTLQKGKMPNLHDSNLKTIKRIDFKRKNPIFYKKLSLYSLHKDNNKFSLRKNNKFFTSLNSLHKNNSLINDNKINSNEKSVIEPKRIFSGLSNKKEEISQNNSIPSNILIDKSPEKEFFLLKILIILGKIYQMIKIIVMHLILLVKQILISIQKNQKAILSY